MATLPTIWLCDADDGPPDVEGTRALNDGLLIGRVLGMDIQAALAVLDSVGDGRRLSTEERRTLAAAYDEARRRLAEALDLGGRALPGRADRLLGSEVVAADGHGVLYLKGGRVNLIDLVRTLDAIGEIFRAAEARALPVEIRYA